MNKIFERFEDQPEFQKAKRRITPYHDLIVEIITRRLDLGLTQKELAEKANSFQSRISKIESGEHDIRLSTLTQIAEALGCQVCIHFVPFEDKPFVSVSDEKLVISRSDNNEIIPGIEFRQVKVTS